MPLVRILTEPKNALVKQYQKLFELDDVKLEFTPDAVHEIAHMAVERKTGARGLRAIMESVMMDTMYEVPSDSNVGNLHRDEGRGGRKGKPEVVYRDVTVPKKHWPEDPEKRVTGRSRNGRRSCMRKLYLQDPYPADKRAAAHRNVTAAFYITEICP